MKYVVLSVHQIGSAIRNNDFDEAVQALSRSRAMLTAAVPVLQASELWSLFDRQIHDSHFAAVRRLYGTVHRPGTGAPATLGSGLTAHIGSLLLMSCMVLIETGIYGADLQSYVPVVPSKRRWTKSRKQAVGRGWRND